MKSFTVAETFSATFIYDNTEYNSIITKLLYVGGEMSFKVEFKNNFDNTTGTIGHLKLNDQRIWDDEFFLDKELCKVVGNRIAAHYFGKLHGLR